MIKIKIKIMIDNYKDLTLGKYYELMELDKEGDDIDLVVEMISILSDMDESEVLNLPISQFHELVRKLDFIKDKPKLLKKLPNSIIINGNKYNILKDATQMTAGQYIDYKELAKDMDSIEKNLPLILAVFIVPDGKKYSDGYDIYELSEELKDNISFELAASISNFFFMQSESYSNNILTYLEWTLRKMKRKTRNKEVKMKMTEAISEIRKLKSLVKSGYGLTGLSELEKYTDALLTMSMK